MWDSYDNCIIDYSEYKKIMKNRQSKQKPILNSKETLSHHNQYEECQKAINLSKCSRNQNYPMQNSQISYSSISPSRSSKVGPNNLGLSPSRSSNIFNENRELLEKLKKKQLQISHYKLMVKSIINAIKKVYSKQAAKQLEKMMECINQSSKIITQKSESKENNFLCYKAKHNLKFQQSKSVHNESELQFCQQMKLSQWEMVARQFENNIYEIMSTSQHNQRNTTESQNLSDISISFNENIQVMTPKAFTKEEHKLWSKTPKQKNKNFSIDNSYSPSLENNKLSYKNISLSPCLKNREKLNFIDFKQDNDACRQQLIKIPSFKASNEIRDAKQQSNVSTGRGLNAKSKINLNSERDYSRSQRQIASEDSIIQAENSDQDQYDQQSVSQGWSNPQTVIINSSNFNSQSSNQNSLQSTMTQQYQFLMWQLNRLKQQIAEQIQMLRCSKQKIDRNKQRKKLERDLQKIDKIIQLKKKQLNVDSLQLDNLMEANDEKRIESQRNKGKFKKKQLIPKKKNSSQAINKIDRKKSRNY